VKQPSNYINPTSAVGRSPPLARLEWPDSRRNSPNYVAQRTLADLSLEEYGHAKS
jgi:hypothetical protein